MKHTRKIIALITVIFITCLLFLSVSAAAKVSAPKIRAENIASSGKIKISWDAAWNAASYRVYRSTSKNGTYTLLANTTNTYANHVSAETGKTYYYYVLSVAKDGTRSAKSNIISCTCDLPYPKVTLSNVESSGAIKISWGSVAGATKYQVYRATKENGTYSLVTTTTKTAVTNTSTKAGVTYYYKVRALASKSAANSAFSTVKSRMADLPRPNKITFSNVASSGAIKISWEPVEGAVNYQVARSTTKNGTYSVITKTSDTSAVNVSVEPGKTYYYKVRALHKNSGANSAYSAAGSRICDLPAPKLTLSNVVSTGKNKISWAAIDGAVKYQVYRSTSENGTYTLMYTTSKTSVIHSGAQAGTTYYYKVRAVASNTSANSALSTPKSRMCDLPQPTKLTLSNVAASGAVKISWNPVEGAVKYQVARSTSKNGTYTVITNTTQTSAVNVSVEPGKLYYYKVRAVPADSSGASAYSAIGSRTCDLPAPKLTVSNDSSTGKNTITWAPLAGAKNYKLYCSTSETGTYSLLATVTGTNYTHSSAQAGVTYYYKAMAVSANSAANSAYSAVKSRACDLPQPKLTAVNDPASGKLVLSWEAVEGAVEYQLYRSTQEDVGYLCMTTTAETTCTHGYATVGTNYYYKVRAVSANTDANSVFSAPKAGMRTLPCPVATASTDPVTGNILLTWKAVRDAVGYEVYYGTDTDNPLTLLHTVDVTNYTHLSAIPGTAYRYAVKAVASSPAANSAKSDTVTQTRLLAQPVLTAESDPVTGITSLLWDVIPGAKEYHIYVSAGDTEDFSFLTATDSTSFVHASAQPGVVYRYKSQAISEGSNADSLVTVVTSYTCRLAQPSLTAARDATTGMVVLNWDAVNGATGYEVYCRNNADSDFALLATTAGTSYSHTSATAGVTYSYTVKAIAADKSAASVPSQEVTGTRVYTKLAVPVITAGIDDNYKPTLVWEPVVGAVGYEVYRSMSATGTFTLMKTVTNARYSNTSASDGVTYYYKVRAVCEDTAYSSDYSQIHAITAGNGITDTFVTSYVLTPNAYIYPEPSSNSSTATILRYMDEVQIGADVSSTSTGKWVRLMYKDAIYYTWIPADTTKFTTTKSSFNYSNTANSALQNEVVALALTFKDLPTYYTNDDSSGIPDPTTGKYGFDCSGFASYVINTVIQRTNPLYKLDKNIVTLYNSGTAGNEVGIMYNNGFNHCYTAQTVSVENMQPGDVLFFKGDPADTRPVDHCGIYLGNGEFIHSSSFYDNVCIMPFAGSFEEELVAVRRYYPAQIKPADQTIKTNYAYVYLYAERNDASERIYDFSLGEEVTLLYTSTNDNWGYVRTADGQTGYVLMKRFDLVS